MRPNGSLFVSGRERNSLKTNDNGFEVLGMLPDAAGTLRWNYQLMEKETVLTVSLENSNLQSAFLLLPFHPYPDATIELSASGLLCERRGRKLKVVFPSILRAELIPPKAKGYSTLLKIAFPARGSIRLAFRKE